jgi:HEAT repeat protein
VTLVVAAVALVAALALWSRDAAQSPGAPPSPASLVRAVAAPLLGESTGCALEVGGRVDVKLAVQSSVDLGNTPVPAGMRSVLAESLEATARLEVLAADATRTLLVGELSDVSVTGHVPPSAYAGAFLLELDDACEVVRFARHQATQPPEARLQQAALWELGWRWTKGQESLTRHNARGAYAATATTARVGDAVLAQRRVQSYGQLWFGGEATHVTGFSSARKAQGPWFDTLETDETLEATTGVTRTRVRASATTGSQALTHLDHDQRHYVFVDLLSKAVARREAMPVTATDRALRAQMADRSAAEAVQSTQEAFTKDQNLAAAWPPLRAFLEARPEKTGEVVAELKRGKVTEDGLNPFFIALGNARTPEARDALLGLMRDPVAPPTVRARAMFSLVDRADVGKELASEFRTSSQALESDPNGAARFVATESLLAVSTMAGRNEDPDVRAEATAAVREHLRASADRRTQGTALKALANLGDPALLGEAVPFTTSPEERVRRAAAKVVRRMNPADTEAFSVDFLLREPSLFVKKDLFVTIEAQHFDAKAPAGARLAPVLVDELRSEEHGVIARKALLRLVGGSVVAQEPAVRALLKAQAKRALARRDGLASVALELLTPDEIREVAP